MGLRRVSVTLQAGVYYGNVHETTESGDERIAPLYIRDHEGAWRANGQKDGARPEARMEQLLDFTESEARHRGLHELSARWGENRPELIE